MQTLANTLDATREYQTQDLLACLVSEEKELVLESADGMVDNSIDTRWAEVESVFGRLAVGADQNDAPAPPEAAAAPEPAPEAEPAPEPEAPAGGGESA